MTKIGVVDVGGGLRGIYGAGVFDRCMDDNIRFDYCAGVSAGSANVTSYMAGQRGRNVVFYTEYSGRRQYMSLRNYLFHGSYLDLRYIYGTLSNSDGEYPLDFPALVASGIELCVVTTDAETGKPAYFYNDDFVQDDYRPVMASCCVPIVCKPFDIDGRYYYDGGLSDPIPFHKCFEAGCEKVVVVLTRPRDYRRDPDKDRRSAKMLRRKFKGAGEALANRAVTYNRQLDEAEELAAQGKLLIIAPDDISGLKTLTRDVDVLMSMYDKGYKDGAAAAEFLGL